MNEPLRWLGRCLARYFSKEVRAPACLPNDVSHLRRVMLPCDVLLVEGNTRFSTAIKYLTQSTWSHSAFYLGPEHGVRENGRLLDLVEADVIDGVRIIPLEDYQRFHTRIVRPVGLTGEDAARVVHYLLGRVGDQYDLKNVFDLARYLLPVPPVPERWRRRMLALGSGDPTRAICSTLIAQAFQQVRYPILPLVSSSSSALPEPPSGGSPGLPGDEAGRELRHIRHHSLFAPRDFDVSPYFEIVKPTLAAGFDYRAFRWAEEEGEAELFYGSRLE